MTYEAFLRDPTVPEHSEWVDGEVIPMMSVSKRHAELKVYLMDVLLAFLRDHPLGRIYDEPFQMKPGPDLPGRSPDIMFVRAERLERVLDQFLDGPADLAIEIVSPGSEATDHGDKFFEYEKGGVAEYWILDPHREVADFYIRDATGVFRSANVPPNGAFTSVVIEGLVVHVDWFWEQPPVKTILAQLGVQ